jgi:hypothetical protein
MTISYKLIPFIDGDPVSVQMLVDGEPHLNIPFYPGNRHYEKYLEWVAEGNTPEPADE